MNLKIKTLLAASVMAASTASQAGIVLPADNLIQNGGFEHIGVRSGSWQYYSNNRNRYTDLGWDYGDSAMEIWGTPFLGVTAPEGRQIAELNAHGAGRTQYTFQQSFETEVGTTYAYGFAYKARRHNSESFFAGIEGISDDTLFDDHTRRDWLYFNSSFIATDTTATIVFASNDRLGDTTGNLLDAVYVTNVSEPGIFALLSAGVAGLFIGRRKIK